MHRKYSVVYFKGAEKIMFSYFYISAFCSLHERPTDKIFTDQMLIGKRNLHGKNISGYRVASLHKKSNNTKIAKQRDLSNFHSHMDIVYFQNLSYF